MMIIYKNSYKALSVSAGLSLAAFSAGYTPKTTPEAIENIQVTAIVSVSIIIVTLISLAAAKTSVYAIAIPNIHPAAESIRASLKNSRTITNPPAPIDFFIPISRFLSPTDTSITVIILNPATISETAPTADNIAVTIESIFVSDSFCCARLVIV